MDLKQINELDLQSIGEWPSWAKAILTLLLCAAVAGAWYYFDTKDQLLRLGKVESEEAGLRQTFETKQRKAANLDAYRQQLAEMRESFSSMLRQLPNKTEVDALLVDVSQTGLAAGLEFELFQPSAEVQKDFYAELPIEIRVTGDYHEFGHFISGLAALPRIVTIHDVKIEGKQAPGNRGDAPADSGSLHLKATVKTYRYLEEDSAEGGAAE